MLVNFSPLGLLPDFGGGEMMLILLVVLLLFGGDKMPQLAKSLGKSIREFKKAANDATDEAMKAIAEHDARREQDQNPESLPNPQDKKTNPDLPLNQTSMKSEPAK